MQVLRNAIDKVLMSVCVVLFIEMTIIGTYQIVTRYFFNSPSTVSEEIVTYSFTWLSILGATYVFGKRGHLCMTFFSSKFTGRKKVYLDMFSESCVMLTAVSLFIYGGYSKTIDNLTQETASLGISMGLMYAVVPIAGCLILIYGIMNLMDMLKVLSSPDVDKYGVSTAS
jgi:TRAP-type C4-dicarboxylate transport system permease small subunit